MSFEITSTYFEGRGPAELGRFGYRRDGKPRNRQMVIGVVMMDGWPIAPHVFAGASGWNGWSSSVIGAR